MWGSEEPAHSPAKRSLPRRPPAATRRCGARKEVQAAGFSSVFSLFLRAPCVLVPGAMPASGPAWGDRSPARGSCPALLLLLALAAVKTAANQEGVIGFKSTSLVVEENARVAVATVTRSCAAHSDGDGLCNGHVSVGYSTESPRSVAAPGTVQVLEGSRNVSTSADLRGILMPGDHVRIGWQELRVDASKPVLADAFTLERPFLGDGNPAFVHRVDNRLPGRCIVSQGSTLVTTTEDARPMLAREELLRVGPFTARVEAAGVFNRTHVQLDRTLPLEGTFHCFAEHPYSGLSDPLGVASDRVTPTPGSNQLASSRDNTDVLFPGDIIKVGTHTYPVDSVTASTILLRHPVADEPLTKGPTLAYFRRLKSSVPGLCRKVSAAVLGCDHEVRTRLSVGDYVRFGHFTTMVADLPSPSTIELVEPCTSSCPANGGTVAGDHLYAPLRGSFNVEDGSRAVETLLDTTQLVTRGDTFKLGPVNYVVDHAGRFDARRLTLQDPFTGRTRNETTLFLVRPAATATARPHFDYEPSIGRLYFPRSVMSREVLVHLIDDDVDEPELRIPLLLTDARYEDVSQLTRGLALGCTFSVGAGSATVNRDTSDCQESPLGDILVVGDEVALHDASWRVTAVFPDSITVNASAFAAAEGTLYKLSPSIDAASATCNITVTDDGEKAVALVPGLFSRVAGTVTVDDTTACALLRRGDVISCRGLAGSATVADCSQDDGSMQLQGDTLAGGADFAPHKCQQLAQPDQPGAIQFVSGTYTKQEAVVQAQMGGLRTTTVSLELERVGGTAGHVAVTLETGHPLSHYAAGSAQGSWAGEDIMLPCVLAVRQGAEVAHAPGNAPDLTLFLTPGDLLHIEGHVIAVHAVNSTSVVWGEPLNRSMPLAFPGFSYDFAPARQLTAASHQYGFVDETTVPGSLFSGLDLRGRVAHGGYVKVGDHAARLDPGASAVIEDVADVGELLGAVVDQGSGLATTTDFRAGFRQEFECYATGGFFRVRCDEELSLPVQASATMGTLLDTVQNMGYFLSLTLAGATASDPVCGPAAATAARATIIVEAAAFDDEVCQLDIVRDRLELGGDRGSGVARFRALLGVRRGDYIGSAAGVHRIAQSGELNATALAIDDVIRHAGRAPLAVSRVQRVPLAGTSSAAPLLALREPIFTYRGLAWLLASGSVAPQSWHLAVSEDVRPGLRQQLRCRADSGAFQLQLGDAITAAIPIGAAPSDLEAELVKLPQVASVAATSTSHPSICGTGSDAVDVTLSFTLEDGRRETLPGLRALTRTASHATSLVLQTAKLPSAARGDAILANGIPIAVSMDQTLPYNDTHLPLARPWAAGQVSSTQLFRFGASDAFFARDFDSLPDTTVVEFPHGASFAATTIRIVDDGLLEDTESIPLRIMRPRRLCAETNCAIETRLFCSASAGSFALARDDGGVQAALQWNADEATVRSTVQAAFGSGVAVFWRTSTATLCSPDPVHYVALVEEVDPKAARPLPFYVADAGGLEGAAYATEARPRRSLSPGWAPPTLGARATAVLSLEDASGSACGTFRLADANVPLPVPSGSIGVSSAIVERTGGAGAPATVELVTKSGSAECTSSMDSPVWDGTPADCVSAVSTIFFGAGVTRLPFTIRAIPDLESVESKYFSVRLVGVSGRGCTLDSAQSERQVEVLPVEASSVSLRWREAEVRVLESAGTVALALERAQARGPVTVSVTATATAADEEGRFALLVDSVDFTTGQTVASVPLQVHDDLLRQGPSLVTMEVVGVAACGSAPCSYNTTGATMRVVVEDDDDADPDTGMVGFAAANFSALESSLAAEITLTRLGGASGDVPVQVVARSLAGAGANAGTAVEGVTFESVVLNVTLVHGQVEATLAVPLIADPAFGGEERKFEVAISPDGSAPPGSVTSSLLIRQGGTAFPAATVHIADEGDVPGVVGFAGGPDLLVQESAEVAIVTVTRTRGASGTVSVEVETRGVTALAGHPMFPASDYGGIFEGGSLPRGVEELSAERLKLTLGEGVSAVPFMLRILDDACAEGREVVELRLHNFTVLDGVVPEGCPMGTCQGLDPGASAVNVTITDEGEDEAGAPAALSLAGAPWKHSAAFLLNCSEVDASSAFSLEVTLLAAAAFPATGLTCSADMGVADLEGSLLRTGASRNVQVRSLPGAAPALLVEFGDLEPGVVSLRAVRMGGRANVSITAMPQPEVRSDFVSALPTLSVELVDACGAPASALAAPLALEASLVVSTGNPCLRENVAGVSEVHEIQITPLTKLNSVVSVSVGVGSKLMWLDLGGAPKPPTLIDGVVLYIGGYTAVGHGTATGGSQSMVFPGDAAKADEFAPGTQVLLNGTSYVVERVSVDNGDTALFLDHPYDGAVGQDDTVLVVRAPYAVTLARTQFQLDGRSCLVDGRSEAPIAFSPATSGIEGADVEIAFQEFTLGNPAVTTKATGITQGPHLDLGSTYVGPTQSHQPVYVKQDSAGRLALELDQPFSGPPALAAAPVASLSIAAQLPPVAVTNGSDTIVMSEDLRAYGFGQGDAINLKGRQHVLASFPGLVATDQSATSAGSSLTRTYVVKLGTEAFTPNWRVDEVLQVDDIVAFSPTSTDRYRARILPRTDTEFSVNVTVEETKVTVEGNGTLPSLDVGDRLSFGGAGHVNAHKITAVSSVKEFTLETDAGTEVSTNVTQHSYAFTLISLAASASVSGKTVTLSSPTWDDTSVLAAFPGDFVAIVPSGGDESQPIFHYLVASTDPSSNTITLSTAPSSTGSVSVYLVMFQVALDKAFTGQSSAAYSMLKVSREVTLDRAYEGKTVARVQPYDASGLTGTFSLVVGGVTITGLDSSITASELQQRTLGAGLSNVQVRRSFSNGGWKWQMTYESYGQDVSPPQLCENGMCDGAGEVGTAGILLSATTRSQGRQQVQPDLSGRVRLPVAGSSCGHLEGTTVTTVATGSAPRADFSSLYVKGLQEGYHIEVVATTDAVAAVQEGSHSKTRPEPLRVTTPPFAITGAQVAAMRVTEHPGMALSGRPLGRQPVLELGDSRSGGSVSESTGVTVQAELSVNHAGDAVGGLGTLRTVGKTEVKGVTCTTGSYMCDAPSESTMDDIPEYAVAVIDGEPYQVGSANKRSPLWKQRVTTSISAAGFSLFWGIAGDSEPDIIAAGVQYSELELEDTSGADGAEAKQRNAETVAAEVSSGLSFLEFTGETLSEVVGEVIGTDYIIDITFTSNVSLLSATSGTTVNMLAEGQRGYFTPDVKVIQLSFTGQTTETAIIGAFKLQVGGSSGSVTEWIDFDAPARRSEAVSCMTPSLEERLESLSGVDDVDVRVKEELSTTDEGSERVRVWTVTFRSPRFVGSMSVHSERFCESASINPAPAQTAVDPTPGSKLSVAVASSDYASASTVLNLNGINLVGTWATSSHTFTTDQAWTGIVYDADALAAASLRVCLASSGSLVAGKEPGVATLDAVAGSAGFHIDRPFTGPTGSHSVFMDSGETLSASFVNGRAEFTDLVIMAPSAGQQRPRYQLRFTSSTGFVASSLPFDVKTTYPSSMGVSLSGAVSVGKEVQVTVSFPVDGADPTDPLLIAAVASQIHSEARGSAVDIKGRFSALAATVGEAATMRMILTSTRLAAIQLRTFWDEDRILAWALKCSVGDTASFVIEADPGQTSPVLHSASVSASVLEAALNAALNQGRARVVVPLRRSSAEAAVCGSTADSAPTYIWVTDVPWGTGPLSPSAQALVLQHMGGAGSPVLEPMFHDLSISTSAQTSAISRGMGFASNATALVAGQPADPHIVGAEVDVGTGFQALDDDSSLLQQGDTVRVDFWEPAAVATLCGDVIGSGNVLTFSKSVAGRLWPGQTVEAKEYQYLIDSVPSDNTVQVGGTLDFSGLAKASHSVSLTRHLLAGTNEVTVQNVGSYVVANFSGLAPVVPVQGAHFELTRRRADKQESSIRLSIALNILSDSSAPIQGSYRLQVNAEGTDQVTPRIFARAEASEMESALMSLPNVRSVSVVREISPDEDGSEAVLISLGVLDYVIAFPTHAAITLTVVNNELFSSSSAIQVTQTKGPSPRLAASISDLVAVASPHPASLQLMVAQATAVAREVLRPAPRVTAFDGFGSALAADVGPVALHALPADGFQQLRCHASGGSVDLQVTVGRVEATLTSVPWNAALAPVNGVRDGTSVQERLESIMHALGDATVNAAGSTVTRMGANTNDFAQWFTDGDRIGLSGTGSCTDATMHTVSKQVGSGRPTAATVSFLPPSGSPGSTVLVCLQAAPLVEVVSRGGQQQLCQPYGSDVVGVRVREAHRRALGDFSLTARQGASMTGTGGGAQTLTCTAAAPKDVEFRVRYRGAPSAAMHGSWQGDEALAAIKSALLQTGTMRNVSAQWCSTACTSLCQASGCCVRILFEDAVAHALDWAKGVSFEGITSVYPETVQPEVTQGTATLSTTGSALVETLHSPVAMKGETTMPAPIGVATFTSAVLAPTPGLALRAFLGDKHSLQYTATCRATAGSFSLQLGGSETVVVSARDTQSDVQAKWDSAFPTVSASVYLEPTGAPACTATGLSTLRIKVTTYRGLSGSALTTARWVPALEGDGSELDGCESIRVSSCTANVTQGSGVLTLSQACTGAAPRPGDLLQVDAFPAVVSSVSADGLTISLASPYRGPTAVGRDVYLSWTRDVQLRTGELFASSHPIRVAPATPGSYPLCAASSTAGTTLLTHLPTGHGVRVNDTLRVGGVAHVVEAVGNTSVTVAPPFPRDMESVPVHVLTRDPSLPRAVELRVVSPPGAMEVAGAAVVSVDAPRRSLTLAEAVDVVPGELMYVAFQDGRYASFLVAATAGSTVTATRPLPEDTARALVGSRLLRSAGLPRLLPAAVVTLADAAMVPSGHDVAVAEVVDDRVVQTLRCTATSGSFRLRLGLSVTGPISAGATAADVQSQLEVLAEVGAGDVIVSFLSAFAPGPAAKDEVCEPGGRVFAVVEFLAYKGLATAYDSADRWAAAQVPHVPPLAPLQWELRGGAISRLVPPPGEAGLRGQTRVALTDGVASFPDTALRSPGVGAQVRFRLLHAGGPPSALVLSPRLFVAASSEAGPLHVDLAEPGNGFMSQDPSHGLVTSVRILDSGGNAASTATTQVVFATELVNGTLVPTNQGDTVFTAVDGVVTVPSMALSATGTTRQSRLRVYQWSTALGARTDLLGVVPSTPLQLRLAPATPSFVQSPTPLDLSGEFTVAPNATAVLARVAGSLSRPPAKVMKELGPGDAVQVGGQNHTLCPLRQRTATLVPLSSPYRGDAVEGGSMRRLPTAGRPLPVAPVIHMLDREGGRVGWDNTSTVRVGVAHNPGCPRNELWTPRLGDPSFDGRLQLVRCSYDATLAADMWGYSLTLPGESLAVAVTPLTTEAELATAVTDWAPIGAARVSFLDSVACTPSTQTPATVAIEFTDVDAAQLPRGIVPRMRTRTDRLFRFTCTDTNSTLALGVQGRMTSSFTGTDTASAVAAIASLTGAVHGIEVLPKDATAVCDSAAPPQLYLHVRGVVGGGPARVAVGTQAPGETVRAEQVTLDRAQTSSDWASLQARQRSSLLQVMMTASVAVQEGVATPQGLHVKEPCAGVRLQAWSDATSLTIFATSAPFDVHSGTAAGLRLADQPSLARAGAGMAVPPTVEVVDVAGNRAPDPPFVINASLATFVARSSFGVEAPAGALSGLTAVTADAGVGTFTGLGLTAPAARAQLAFTSKPPLPARIGLPHSTILVSKPFAVAGPPRRLRLVEPWTPALQYARSGSDATQTAEIELAVEVTDLSGLRAPLTTGADGGKMGALQASILEDPYCPLECTSLAGDIAPMAVTDGRAVFRLRVAGLPTGAPALRAESQWVRVASTAGSADEPDGGSFRLAIVRAGHRYQTRDLAHDASGAAMKQAVEELPLALGPVTVLRQPYTPHGGPGTVEWRITFAQEGTNVPQLQPTAVQLTRGGAACSATVVAGTVVEGAAYRLRIRGEYDKYPLVVDTEPFGVGAA